ncbi:unnamed protein product [Nippostrongylus brasiliensis]|uniref:Reverse transcriptase n=1 Tax=Nippostrongylus brasiliensis TaxID=27835 RepID=A0A0N4YI64_NIPBR|nr:unnamed protein product [Nippostrongylus brasiliensis]
MTIQSPATYNGRAPNAVQHALNRAGTEIRQDLRQLCSNKEWALDLYFVHMDFDHACGKIGLQLNLTKTMFMRNGYVSDAPFSLNGTNISEWNGYVSDAPFSLNGTNISECSSYVYLGREVNMTNDLSSELKSWALRKQDEHVICVAQRSIEHPDVRMLEVTRFIQARDGIRSSELRRQSKIRDAVAWAKLSKIRWGGHVMRFRDDRWMRAVTD